MGSLDQEGELYKNRMLKNDLILKRRKNSRCLSNMQNPPPTTCIIRDALISGGAQKQTLFKMANKDKDAVGFGLDPEHNPVLHMLLEL